MTPINRRRLPAEFEGLTLGQIPFTVCLCGSTRFVDKFIEWQRILTLAGFMVLSIEIVTTEGDAQREGTPPDRKQRLDTLHLYKIAEADFVMVLNVDGYIGESTAREIRFAHEIDCPVFYLQSPDLEGNWIPKGGPVFEAIANCFGAEWIQP